MQLRSSGSRRIPRRKSFRFLVLLARSLYVLFLMSSLTVYSRGITQTITLKLKDAPIQEVFNAIAKQTGVTFIYTKSQLEETHAISIVVTNESLSKVLDIVFSGQPLTYQVDGKLVILKKKEERKALVVTSENAISIKGKVVGNTGEPIQGVTVAEVKTGKITTTDFRGEFILPGIEGNSTLRLTSVGFESIYVEVKNQPSLVIEMKTAVKSLDEALVIGYGRISQRYNTGSVSKVSSEEISKQPISNPLAALQGRVPGLIVTQTSGVPGSGFRVQLRGQSSIGISPGSLPVNDPLFIIDGVPYAPNNGSLGLGSSAAGINGVSPLSLINPSDIESIEVLKDADATSIYGSRGANGVILITTKKGKAGKTVVAVNFTTGFAKALPSMDLLDTKQYVAMRKEALANDAKPLDNQNAPDLINWDTTRYTDWKKMFIGGTASFTDAQVSLSGGNENTQFLMGAGYYRETTVFPGNLSDRRASVNLNLSHTSTNKKFESNLQTIYAIKRNNIIREDFTDKIRLAPNAPSLFDSVGNLRWQENGLPFTNPMAYLLREYESSAANLLANLNLSYHIFPFLTVKAALGYNSVDGKSTSIIPIKSQDPMYNPQGYSSFADNKIQSWIIEPQVEFQKRVFVHLKINAIIGTTFQENETQNSGTSASGYTNDALLKIATVAPRLSATNDKYEYRYEAIFGRVNLNWQDRYLLNVSGRRDGSSRFGPGKRFGNFGALGAAWLISNEDFFKNALSLCHLQK
jgi:TonB-linked SusC/RagA family outer membrane protein